MNLILNIEFLIWTEDKMTDLHIPCENCGEPMDLIDEHIYYCEHCNKKRIITIDEEIADE
jgi:hypothetical protein